MSFSGFLFGSTGVVPPLLEPESSSLSLQPVKVEAKVSATAPLAALVIKLRRLMCVLKCHESGYCQKYYYPILGLHDMASALSWEIPK